MKAGMVVVMLYSSDWTENKIARNVNNRYKQKRLKDFLYHNFIEHQLILIELNLSLH